MYVVMYGTTTPTHDLSRANMPGHLAGSIHVIPSVLSSLCHTYDHHMSVNDFRVIADAAHVVRMVAIKVCISQGMMLSILSR